MTSPAPRSTGPRTFDDLLRRRLADRPGAPLVTFYDRRSGERTELSVTSYANWVAKHANLLREELDLDDDATVLVDLPAHWLVPVVLGGAWLAGLAVTTDPAVPHDAVVSEVDHVERYAAGGVPVVACALHPFALPAATPLPPGVLDHGHLWPGQSDVHVAVVPPSGAEVAWRAVEGSPASQAELLAEAGTTEAAVPGERLLTTRHPATDRGVPDLLVPLLAGSVVLVRHLDEDPGALESLLAQEQVTRTRT